MPWHDWQFWVVTAAAIVALAALLRPLLRRLLRRPGERRVALTVRGREPA